MLKFITLDKCQNCGMNQCEPIHDMFFAKVKKEVHSFVPVVVLENPKQLAKELESFIQVIDRSHLFLTEFRKKEAKRLGVLVGELKKEGV